MSVAPAGWDRLRVEHCLREERRSVEPATAFDGEVFHYSIPVLQSTGDGAVEPAEEIRSAKLWIRGPSVLVSKLNPRKGAVVLADDRGIPTVCSSEFICLRPKSADLRFAYYVFLSESVRQSLEALVKSATRSHQRVVPSDLTKLKLAWPPLSTQRAIASFLDRETAKIDTLIEKKQRLLELLEEKRTALITQAVTKGLDPDVPMKDSGVEWLGEIPAHWEVVHVRRIVRMKSGESITADDIEAAGDYPVFGGNGLRGYGDRFTHEGRHVLIGRQGALAGNINYADGRFFASEHAVVVTPVRPVDVTWLGETLRAMNLNQFAEAAAQPGIAVSDVLALRFPLPPLAEQEIIARHLRRSEEEATAVRSAVEKGIRLLREYRTALISAAVTGKLDIPVKDSAA